ncbi:MAG TPA: hypothetical protein VIV15_07255 [Anaerolineales bacterium]
MNLKPYLDAAQAADAEKKRILAEMDAAFNEGTPEGKEKALSLRPALDEATAKAEEANRLYTSMRDASLEQNNLGALFTVPPDPAIPSNQSNADGTPKSMTRAEYNALHPRERLAYAKSGGELTD